MPPHSNNTEFTLLGRQLHLARYPKSAQHPSLQAWDAADQYLLEYLVEQQINPASLSILNDQFGTLACWFADTPQSWQSDSKVAELALRHNLNANGLSDEQITFCTSMQTPRAAELILIKIPKTLALLEQQLIQLQQVVTPSTRVIAAGMVKHMQKSVLSLFEKHLGETRTSLAKKKARLIFCQPDGNKTSQSPYPTCWQHNGWQIHNHANVFSRQSLDIGARLLLEHLPDCQGKTLVDLGCGNGILGLAVLQQYPDAKVMFVDESYMAVASARLNVAHNLPERLNDCHFIHSNCLDDWPNELGKVDVVLCNPPFHQQNTISDHIAWQMFNDAKQRLHIGGELRIIGNRHLDYPRKLKRLFGGYRVVASDQKFSILASVLTANA